MQAEDGQSLAIQQRQLEGWAMQHRRTFDAMHIEAGISGAVPFPWRPEGSRLWAGLTKGDVLVASELDRMFRSAGDCLAWGETHSLTSVVQVQPLHVAAWVQELTHTVSVPTVKLRLAAIRHDSQSLIDSSAPS